MGHKGGKSNCVHYTYYSMSKGTCWAEETSSGEKLQPIHLAINELCLPKGIKQLVDQSVENSVKFCSKFCSNINIIGNVLAVPAGVSE